MRVALYWLLGAVALAAAVLSFDALRSLALLCGFARPLAWLLPVVVDAGAAAGSLVWLGGRAEIRARRFAKRLALALLGISVAANAVGHLLALYAGGRAPWWVVAVASGLAPAVLGALIHLGVLCGRDDEVAEPPVPVVEDEAALVFGPLREVSPPHGNEAGGEPPDRAAELIAAGVGRRVLARELQITPHEARKLLAARRNGSG